MIIILKRNADQEKVNVLRKELEGMGLSIHDSIGSESHIMGLVGDTKAVAESWVMAHPVVEACRRVSEPYKKASPLCLSGTASRSHCMSSAVRTMRGSPSISIGGSSG